MEIEEFKEIWKKYDEKLDKIEQVNRKILQSIISKKTEKKLYWMNIQSLIGILTYPIILIFVIIPLAYKYEINPIGFIGLSLLTLIFIYFLILAIKYYKLISLIKPTINTFIETRDNIVNLKRFVLRKQKIQNFIYPIMVLALISILFKQIDYKNTQKLIIFIIMSVGIFFWVNFKSKIYSQDRITLIEKEIAELEEF